MRGISDHLDKIAFDTGIAKIVGGGCAVTSGIMMGAGIVLAPTTGGVSMALTAGVSALAFGSTIIKFTSFIIKDY
jgi:hypothetical protein